MKPSIQSAIAVIALTLMASNHALLQHTCKAAQESEVTTQGSTRASSATQSSDQIPVQNLQIPDDLKPCAERLRTIYAALKKYERDKGSMPDWLSDLVPDYLSAELLIWPEDGPRSTPLAADQHLPCSFGYQYSSSLPLPEGEISYRDFKDEERKVWGDVVPLVRYYIGKQCLNISFDGRIYMSGTAWESDIRPQASAPEVLVLREISVPASPGAGPVRKVPEPVAEQSKVLAFDDFDGKLTLKWEIINPNLSNFSLTKKPGSLTIKTQDGHFKEANTDYENLFLIEAPVQDGQDFQITTCLSDFRPLQPYNQAGLICWDDEDNYLEWIYQKMERMEFALAAGVEANGPTQYTYIPAGAPAKQLWLRLTKRGDSYACSSSTDGQSFTVHTVERWGDGSPRRIGLFAINGSLTHPPEVDASFEFFEVATPSKPGEAGPAAQAAARSSTGKYRIPPENLKIPDDCKACAENLRKICDALHRHKKDKGQLPNALSDLVPHYLDQQVLLCPTGSIESAPLSPDPKLPCSYGYQYSNRPISANKTQRQWKDEQRELCGDVVPLVRCYGHEQCLNLSFGGEIYVSSLVWERDLDTEGGALRQSASPAQSGAVSSATTPLPRGEGGVSFEDDLEAFIREMDSTYPFFELKGIHGDWEQTKRQLREQVRTCQSDERFLEIVKDAVLSLRDSHMWFRDSKIPIPQWPAKYYPGISFTPATNERVVVMSCREGLDPDLKIGAIVSKIDGKNARQHLEEQAKARWAEGGISGPQRARLFAYRIALRGETKGEKHTITTLVDGKEREIEVTSDVEAGGWPHWYNRPENLREAGSCSYTKLRSGAGYVYLRRVDASTGPGLKEAFSTYSDAKGWIIDLRGNGGGGYDQALSEALRALPTPLAVIIDAGCMSAGETLARDFVQRGNARLFGSKTAGASSAKRSWTFPSGIASLTIPTRSRWGIGGKPIEFNGIEPHVEVEAAPEELAQGLNSAICRAEEYLAEMSTAEGR